MIMLIISMLDDLPGWWSDSSRHEPLGKAGQHPGEVGTRSLMFSRQMS